MSMEWYHNCQCKESKKTKGGEIVIQGSGTTHWYQWGTKFVNVWYSTNNTNITHPDKVLLAPPPTRESSEPMLRFQQLYDSIRRKFVVVNGTLRSHHCNLKRLKYSVGWKRWDRDSRADRSSPQGTVTAFWGYDWLLSQWKRTYDWLVSQWKRTYDWLSTVYRIILSCSVQ